GDGRAGLTHAREDGVAVTRIGTGDAGALFYGDGAPEALERGGLPAWIAAAHFSAALRCAAAAAAPGWDRMVSHWLVPCGWAALRAEARARLGLRGATVVAVGRLIPIKGFDLLVDAVGDLARLVVIGAGPEAPPLRARARRRGVSLDLPGFLPRAQLATWLAA